MSHLGTRLRLFHLTLIYLESLLLVEALSALVLSINVRRTPGVVATAVGFAMILLAYLAGIWFLSLGQQSMSSLWMSLGFLGALLAYLLGYGVTPPARKEAQSK